MIQSGAKSLKNSGGVGGGGGAAAPPMMIEKIRAKNLQSSGRMMIEEVMIQLGAKSPKDSGGVGGGGSPPMIVMIQKGQKNTKKSAGGFISSSAAKPHGTSEDSNTGKLIPVKHLKRSGRGPP